MAVNKHKMRRLEVKRNIMDFTKFQFKKNYIRNDNQFSLNFDFSLRELTGHNRKTFDDCQSLLYFLKNNPGKQIYLTRNQIPDFCEEDNKLVINIGTYQEFCKKIGQNGKNRTQAFLAQKIKHYSDDEKKEIISNSSEEEIIERIRNFSDKQRDLFNEKLKDEGLSKDGDSNSKPFLVGESNTDGVFIQISDVKNRDWVIEQLKRLESENFENLGSAIGQARLENTIEKFEKNISNTNEEFWQVFFEENPWILQQVFAFPVIYLNGETYLGGKNSKGRQGAGGSATDFLFMSGSNGSFAVVEIKTPGCLLTGSCYHGEKESGNKNEIYRIHGDLTGGIVQLEKQIHTAIEYFKTQIGEDFEGLTHLNPTGVIVAGTYSKMKPQEKNSFDLFRKAIGKNQIFTFDEVLVKLHLLKNVYGK